MLGLSLKGQPLEGQKYKLAGRIITNTPDPSDSENEYKTWEPQTFDLWAPMPKAKNVMADIVKLDIDSLNRDERAFIKDRCGIISYVRCDAVIFGHVGTVQEERDIGLRYRGMIVDEVIINPIDAKSAASD